MNVPCPFSLVGTCHVRTLALAITARVLLSVSIGVTRLTGTGRLRYWCSLRSNEGGCLSSDCLSLSHDVKRVSVCI